MQLTQRRRRPCAGLLDQRLLAELQGSHERLADELLRRAEAAEARAEAAEAQAREQHERAGRAEAEREAVQTEAAAFRADVTRLRDEVLAERERANAALKQVAEVEARLAAGSPIARAAKAWRAFLAYRRGGKP